MELPSQTDAVCKDYWKASSWFYAIKGDAYPISEEQFVKPKKLAIGKAAEWRYPIDRVDFELVNTGRLFIAYLRPKMSGDRMPVGGDLRRALDHCRWRRRAETT